MSRPRTLPLRLSLVDGEAMDSWVEALARRYRIASRPMLGILGIPRPAPLVRTLLDSTETAARRRIEQAAGLTPGRLDASVGADLREVDRLHSGGSRFCPRCLVESGGRWQLSWRLNWTVVCTRHDLILNDLCPACGAAQRTYLPGGLEPIGAATCTGILKRPMLRCAADLSTAPLIPAGSDALQAQRWIDALTADLTDPETADDARAVFADLPTVAAWLLRHEFTDDEPVATRRRHLPRIGAEVTAAVLARAKTVLGQEDDSAIAALKQIVVRLKTTKRVPPPNISQQHWKAMVGVFPNRYLRAADADLFPIERLRLKSATAAAGIPKSDTALRRRWLPQLLWPDWTSRLLPVAGMNPELFRAVMSICLLIPGSADKDVAGVAASINPRVTRAHISVALQQFGTMDGPMLPHIVGICCRLAALLDTEGAPIDYQRRRDMVPTELICWQQWRSLAPAIGAHPGDRANTGRHRHVQRHLHQLLTGSDLADRRHGLAFTDAADRSRYIDFLLSLTPAVRQGLRGHAESVLADLGIDEPLVWSPPMECAAGLAWPGIDADALDMEKIRRILVEERGTPGEAADRLGVNIEHVRLALEHLDRPERQWIRHGPQALQRQQLAARTFTREFFEREYLTGGRTLAQIGESTGFTKKTVADYARAAGIAIAKGAPPMVPLDEQWLKDQYLRHRRSTADIAAEFGTTQMTVNRALDRLGVPLRPSGVASHPHMVQVLDGRLPRDLRAAVEGGLHGWQRLRRFQIAMAFPSLESAAEYLGTGSSALVVQFQRLESDIGAELFHRSAYGKPHRPTERGSKLLKTLSRPNVLALMDDALDRRKPQDPDPEILAEAAIRNNTRRNPSPPKPFEDIAVEPIRMSQPLRTLLRDAIDQQWAEFYGWEITERTEIYGGTLYPLLKRLLGAGWLTSRPEDEASWLTGAPSGRGPGRRRTYYTFTAEGKRAALRQLGNHAITRPTSG